MMANAIKQDIQEANAPSCLKIKKDFSLSQTRISQIENIIFEGGGIKGYCFGGAVKRLEELGILPQIKRYGGSSAGSIIAGALAIGANADQVQEILRKTDFKAFQDRSKRPFRHLKDSFRFLFKYGLYKGDALYKWFGGVIKDLGENPNLTFQEVYDKYGKELVITGTNVNLGQTIYFHHVNYPNMPVRQAVRISTSLPWIFKTVKLDGHHYVDGGVLNPYPLWIFDNEEQICCYDVDNPTNPKTIGFKLMGSDERPDQYLYHGEHKTNNLLKFTLALFNNLLWQAERGHIRPGYWERTIVIDTFDIKATDFDIDDEKKQKLWYSGYYATDKYFQKESGE